MSHGRQILVLRILIGLLALLALPRVVYETRRLLVGQSYWDATDIKNFHNQATVWYSGQDIYATVANANYPPASYPIIYLIYFLDNDLNRWVWCVHGAIILGLLIGMCVRESGADSKEERVCVALLPLAMFTTGVAFGNGQLTIQALAASTAAILLLYRSRGRIAWQLAAAGCMLFSLVKPNLTAPFFWIFLIVPHRKQAAIFVLIGYALLTLLGASFQPGSLTDQIMTFIAKSKVVSEQHGYGDVPLWLTKLGLSNLITPFMLIGLAGMGMWVWANRNADRWLLYGGLAIMARLWSYHQLYDDLLNLFAFIALIRLAKGIGNEGKPDELAWIVILIALTTLPGPATPLRFWRGWMSLALAGWNTAVRLLMLLVIILRAREQQRRSQSISGPEPILATST